MESKLTLKEQIQVIMDKEVAARNKMYQETRPYEIQKACPLQNGFLAIAHISRDEPRYLQLLFFDNQFQLVAEKEIDASNWGLRAISPLFAWSDDE